MTNELGQRKEGDELALYLAERAGQHPDLTPTQLIAAYSLGFGDPPEQVSEELGINRNDLAQWRSFLPFAEFEAQVTGTARKFKQGDYKTSGAQVATLTDLAQRLMDLLDCRARLYRGTEEGGNTGLLQKRIVYKKSGEKTYERIEEWMFDPKPLERLEATFKHISELLGWDVREGKTGKPVDRPTVMGMIAAADADKVISDSNRN